MFVSSTAQNGNFGGVQGADDLCESLAASAGLPGKFVAWMSSGELNTQALDRLDQADVPYRLVDGTKIADNWDDLTDNSLDNPINRDENGVVRSGSNNVWTGADGNGTGIAFASDSNVNCNNWTGGSSSLSGRVGSSAAIDEDWTNTGDNIDCNLNRRLYCVQSNPKCGSGNGKCIFVTDDSFSAVTGGLVGADALCQAAADAASTVADGTYKAWLSNSNLSAADRLTHATGAYRLPNGDRVATNWDDLTDGSLENPLCINEYQMHRSSGCGWSGGSEVWTATDANGTYMGPASCSNWSSNSGTVTVGDFVGSAPLADWSNVGTTSCGGGRHLYCLQQ